MQPLRGAKETTYLRCGHLGEQGAQPGASSVVAELCNDESARGGIQDAHTVPHHVPLVVTRWHRLLGEGHQVRRLWTPGTHKHKHTNTSPTQTLVHGTHTAWLLGLLTSTSEYTVP